MRSSILRRTPTSTQITAALLCTSMLLSACAVGPDYKRPSLAVPAVFKEAPAPLVPPAPPKNFIGPVKPVDTRRQLAKAEPKDAVIKGSWWEVFNDPALNKLEEQVAINNQNVKLAEGNYRQARALVEEARASFFPTLGTTTSMERSGTGAGAGTSSGSTLGGVIHNSYNAELQASWEPDLWGKIRRQVESAKANAQANAADLANATLSAQASLAVDYIDLRLADEQKRILDRSIEAFSRSLTITQNQYKTGVAANSDVLLAKVQLETTQAQQVDVGVLRAQYEHAIAVLIGKSPADLTISVVDNVPVLPEIPAGVPSQLLERRPDIAAAERNVAAANAQIGVAEAAYFPDITLSATGGYASSELYHWFMMPNRFWSIGPSLVETLFDAGLRAAQTDAAIAVYDQNVATYRQTTLAAFEAVEDNLAALRIYAQEADVLQGAVKDSKASVQVELNQYKAGIVSYLNVVTTQTTELNNELTELTVRKARMTTAAFLIENLGGGWNAATLKKPGVTEGNTGILSILPPPFKQH